MALELYFEAFAFPFRLCSDPDDVCDCDCGCGVACTAASLSLTARSRVRARSRASCFFAKFVPGDGDGLIATYGFGLSESTEDAGQPRVTRACSCSRDKSCSPAPAPFL